MGCAAFWREWMPEGQNGKELVGVCGSRSIFSEKIRKIGKNRTMILQAREVSKVAENGEIPQMPCFVGRIGENKKKSVNHSVAGSV